MAKRPSGLRIDNPSWPLLQALISYWGVTDAAGGGGGATLLCADLANQPEFDGNQVVVVSGAFGGQARDINGTTLAGVVTPNINFGGVIPASTIFAILSIRTTPAEVAALTALVVLLMADVGDPTGETLPSLATKWGDIARSLDLILGARWDAAGDLGTDIAAILAGLNGLLEPAESLLETWQDLLIDPNIWAVTDPAVGAAWNPSVAGAFLYNITTPNANENARLVGIHPWQLHSITPNLNLIVKKTIMEWSMIIGVPGNINNAQAFFGFIPDVGNTRANDNIIGFCLLGDVLATLTDLGSAETENTTFGENLTLHNKFRIEVYEGFVDFYLNEVRIAQHATNIPNVPSYPNFYIQTDADGACALSVGIIKVRYEMVERY